VKDSRTYIRLRIIFSDVALCNPGPSEARDKSSAYACMHARKDAEFLWMVSYPVMLFLPTAVLS
jgi:hypothetical protein